MKKLQYLIIHCTATPENRKVSSNDIRNWHLKGRGWKRVGYSDMIHLDGKIENLHPWDSDGIKEGWEITNGAKGYNSISHHVVYVGGCDSKMKPKDTRTPEQKLSLQQYVEDIIALFPDIKVIGHNQVANKACPSFNVPKWLESICINEKNIGYEI
ncbi:N-acetylmuramoyl-L-alanine amidase [Aureivirga marina]|uniref:N-acetylmuramoyl-L-alanine amidase n=1 Tax=Aureivirga marina TaxID=1182451 RepID=UPI0018CACE8A|nr:N-acetylmuramoyl-L-alanine amidase [Aureivirga marina]